MSANADRIERFLINLEWPHERLDETLWRTLYQGDLQLHEIFISADEDGCVSFRSRVCGAPKAESTLTVYRHLLRLNSLIPLTKFCIAASGDVFALLDLPTQDIVQDEFRAALTAIVNHVDHYDNEIIALCEDPARRSSFEDPVAST
ncbi:MAG TPA: YbjN domain-containing protein [Oscillatoriaceae cyanobacterium]